MGSKINRHTGRTQAMLEDVAERFLFGEGGYVVFATWRSAVDIGVVRFEEILCAQLPKTSEPAKWWKRTHTNTFLKIAGINEGIKIYFLGPLVNRLRGSTDKIYIDHYTYVAADREQLGDLIEEMEDRVQK